MFLAKLCGVISKESAVNPAGSAMSLVVSPIDINSCSPVGKTTRRR